MDDIATLFKRKQVLRGYIRCDCFVTHCIIVSVVIDKLFNLRNSVFRRSKITRDGHTDLQTDGRTDGHDLASDVLPQYLLTGADMANEQTTGYTFSKEFFIDTYSS